MTAKERALALLNRRDYSRGELLKKLLEKGEEPEAAEAAVERLAELGFVDDARYARLIVRHYAAKGYGARRVKQELHHRGIPPELFDEAMEQMPEQDETVDRLLRSRLKSEAPDRGELKKASDFLLRRGYSWDEVRAALRRYNASIEEEY